LFKGDLSDFDTIQREIAGKRRKQSLWRRVPRLNRSGTVLTRGRGPVELALDMKVFTELARIAGNLGNPD
jgi:hypothetical protein